MHLIFIFLPVYLQYASYFYIFTIQNHILNILCLSVCLFVRLYPINVKTAEPNGPKFLFFFILKIRKNYFCSIKNVCCQNTCLFVYLCMRFWFLPVFIVIIKNEGLHCQPSHQGFLPGLC